MLSLFIIISFNKMTQKKFILKIQKIRLKHYRIRFLYLKF